MKAFFDAVRPMFRRGRMQQAQVSGLAAIVEAGVGMPRSHLAYVLATVFHETGQRMQPIREGFCKTDAGSRRAVRGLFDKGIILHNYALPEANGHSYYGRGLVQITWGDNYKKFGIYDNPDQALLMPTALDILFVGMIEGRFREGNDISIIPGKDPTLVDFIKAREIINGDTRKNGRKIADQAVVFYNALLLIKAHEEPQEEEPHTLWCKLLDFVGLGEHSDTGD